LAVVQKEYKLIMKTRQRTSIAAPILLIIALQCGCTGVPDGVQTVVGFELDRYLGTWYEVARLDHSFERGMSHVTANYSIRDDGGVSVVNRGYKVAPGEWDEATGKAYFVGDADVGQLKVSFFGPFYGAYNILELDKDNYQYALVAGPDRGYLWILARSPKLDQDVMSALVNKATSLDFPTDELIYVDHAETGDPE
jgi:apolipoprotein D and lipocalin family protein